MGALPKSLKSVFMGGTMSDQIDYPTDREDQFSWADARDVISSSLKCLPHETYQIGLAAAAYARHGSPLSLKGIVHEHAYALWHNVNPLAVYRDGWASLSANLRDPIYDIVFSNGGGVQLKDTISAPGIRDTAQRLYPCAVLGTDETVIEMQKIGKRIEPSGFSSLHNEGIALRTGAPKGWTWAPVVANVQKGALIGAASGIAMAFYKAHVRVRSGETTWEEIEGELTSEVRRECFIGGFSGALAAGAGTLAAVITIPAGWPALIIGILVSLIVGAIATKGAEVLWPKLLEWINDAVSFLSNFVVQPA
jgi:hypothetical protein